MSKSKITFLILSLFIATSDALFVYINRANDRDALQEALANQGLNLEHGFQLSLRGVERTMAMLATYVANDPQNRRLFGEAVAAVEAEGGGSGGVEADRLRQRLAANVAPCWNEVARDYQVRQLHFHIGPGSLSFLRVHKPSKFGDRMDECRYTVVHANATGETVTGFETGRVVSGIRGVVPVKYEDPQTGRTRQVGALEAGTSFATILPSLAEELGADVAIYLTGDHVRRNIWPEMIGKAFEGRAPVGDFYVEGTTFEGESPLFDSALLGELYDSPGTRLVESAGRQLAVTSFPLRDFHGESDPALPPVGLVVLWQNADHQVAAMAAATRTNILYAVLGFLLLEAGLLLAVRRITAGLNEVIRARTDELRSVQGRLLEAARLSGKSEVATEVLHNVGNVLNSVVTAVGTLRRRAVESRTAGLLRVAQLVHEHEGDWEAFATLDQRGRLLPRYLREIAAELGRERQDDLADLQRLGERIEHINTIVRQQESYATAQQVCEPVRVRGLLDSALEILADDARAAGVAVRCAEAPEVVLETDRHLLLQIVVNLLRNAIEAAGGRPDARVEVEAKLGGGNELTIEVRDNGCGWSEETGRKLFTHGFTSKEQGRGLGLHSSWLAARHLDGRLVGRSDGEGQGARFALTLPVEVLEESRV